MRLRTLVLVLVIAGVGADIASIVIGEQNSGSCPAAAVGSPSCDHAFPGTTIWIGRTATEVGIVALTLLASGVAVALYGSLTGIAKDDGKLVLTIPEA